MCTKSKPGAAQLTGSDGGILRVAHNAIDDRPTVQRQGVTRQWDEEIDVYKTSGPLPADNANVGAAIP